MYQVPFHVEVIIFLSFLVWMLPPLRHYKKEYFAYFFFTSLMDLSQLFFVKVLDIKSNVIILFLSFFLLPSVYRNITKKKNLLLTFISVTLVTTAVFALINNSILTFYPMILVRLILCGFFIKRIIFSLVNNASLNLLLPLLLFYEFSLVIKIANAAVGPGLGFYYFYIMNVLHILLGLTFCVVTERTKVFSFPELQSKTDNY